MGESKTTGASRSKTPKERLFSNPSDSAKSARFGTVVRALWPIKPALNLAQRSGVSERGAQFYIDGQRKPSWRAIRAVIDEISE
jgi:hypothetical protein